MSKKDSIIVIDISSSSEEEDDVPLMHLLRTQMKKNILNTPMKDENKTTKPKYRNYDADCVVLDYNPFESIDLSSKLSLNSKDEDEDADDVAVISEKGQVACRDFPHSRHLCVKFPFEFTPHLSHCEQCYCYVCDSVAPCKFWNDASGGHCHAKKALGWDAMRKAARPTPTPQ